MAVTLHWTYSDAKTAGSDAEQRANVDRRIDGERDKENSGRKLGIQSIAPTFICPQASWGSRE